MANIVILDPIFAHLVEILARNFFREFYLY